MRKWIFFLVLGVGVFRLCPVCAQPGPEMFAYGMRLDVSGEEGLYEMELPLAVYQGVVRKDLGDMRVFNAAGQVVPHSLRKPATATLQKREVIGELPFFPVYVAADRPDGAFSLHVERNEQGTIVDVRSADEADPGKQARIVSYLVDSGSPPRQLTGLSLTWSVTEPDFIGEITVAASDDLLTWRHLATATIARLSYQGRRLQQSDIVIPAPSPRYLRLTWPSQQQAFKLSAVTAFADTSAIKDTPHRQWIAVQAVADPDEPAGRLLFDLKGFVPVDRLRITPDGENFLANGALFCDDGEKNNPRQQWEGLLYRLRIQGRTILAPAMDVRPLSHRFWRLTLMDGDTTIDSVSLKLEFGWRPDRLVFLARGQGPFQLAYGSTVVEPAGGALAESLFGGTSLPDGSLVNPTPIAPSSPYRLGGEEKLQPVRTLPWQKYILWAVLSAGVFMIGRMSVVLYRQMQGAAVRGEKDACSREDE